MVSSPVQNISDFLKNRPPLVVFLLCLVALAVSTFYFAFQIEEDGPTIDSEKQHDWDQMLKHFNKLDTCIGASTWTNDNNKLEKYKDEISVSTKVTFENMNFLKSYSEIQGALILDGWYSTSCQNPNTKPKTVQIFFNIPSTVSQANNSLDICVTLKGPAEYLPYFGLPNCDPIYTKNTKGSKAFLSSKLPRTVDSDFCKHGEISKLRFGVEQNAISNYLSDDVRTQIYIHLMWCSYFLVFIIFCILVFAICQKSDLKKNEATARLL